MVASGVHAVGVANGRGVASIRPTHSSAIDLANLVSMATRPGRRDVLLRAPPTMLLFLTCWGELDCAAAVAAAGQVEGVVIDLSKAPDPATYDPSDPDLRQAAALIQEALNATDVRAEEAIWTDIIDRYGSSQAPWAADVVGRAIGNRGNARARQGRLEAALLDYGEAIKRCPWSVDPVLNRGVALEGLGRFREAIADYRAVLAVSPQDPAAWNNLGNATAGTGEWEAAIDFYKRAVALAPQFAFAVSNLTLAEYEVGKNDGATLRSMRALLRRYPEFSDVRAALTAALWESGLQGQAEDEWRRVDDPRYRDLAWLRNTRRWPPRLVRALTSFLELKPLSSSQ